MVVERLVFTPAVAALVRSLKATQGPLIFHLSGGCCEGSAPMCLKQSDFHAGAQDVLLGEIDGCPFYVGAAQFEYWAPWQIVIDVTDSGGDSFSLEAADGVRFTATSRPFIDEERAKAEFQERRPESLVNVADVEQRKPRSLCSSSLT